MCDTSCVLIPSVHLLTDTVVCYNMVSDIAKVQLLQASSAARGQSSAPADAGERAVTVPTKWIKEALAPSANEKKYYKAEDILRQDIQSLDGFDCPTCGTYSNTPLTQSWGQTLRHA